MARSQGKGWFRTRQKTKGEVVYFCHYSEDPATGTRKEKLHKLGPVSQFPDEASGLQEVGRLGLTSFIDNPISEVTFEGLVNLYIDSGAIGQKTLSQKGQWYGGRYSAQPGDALHAPAAQHAGVQDSARVGGGGLLSLHQEKKLALTTINKMKHAMQGVFKFGRKKKFLPADFDRFQDIDCEASSDYEAITCSPKQTLEILNQLEGGRCLFIGKEW